MTVPVVSEENEFKLQAVDVITPCYTRSCLYTLLEHQTVENQRMNLSDTP